MNKTVEAKLQKILTIYLKEIHERACWSENARFKSSSCGEMEQIQRYRNALPNFILTNFSDFRLYKEGKLIKTAEICRFPALAGLSR